MLVRGNGLPPLLLSDPCNTAKLDEFAQFFLTGQAITNVVVINLTTPFVVLVFDEQGHSNTSHAAASKNILSFLRSSLTQHVFPDISPQVQHMNAGKFLGQTFA
ncbi:hypothetical protein FEMY_24930 [Ferrovum myxofaciens]|uniref:Uncharacterized protein n=1 Tax=Ferrovum myxofaciens TaxID=416213 RepID=A0A149VUU9_9PROT|nr:hypothetical protein FEMY_24930 [Ferrovum myxofaciens]